MAHYATARPVPRHYLSIGSVHPAENDVSAGKARFHAVIHVFHLAQQQAGADRVLHRAHPLGGEGLLSSTPVRQHAGYQSVFFADIRSAWLPDPRRARGDTIRTLGDVFRSL